MLLLIFINFESSVYVGTLSLGVSFSANEVNEDMFVSYTLISLFYISLLPLLYPRHLQPPYFPYHPRSITVLTGSLAMISCGGRGNLLPSITWKRIIPDSGLLYAGQVEKVTLDTRVSASDYFLLICDVQLVGKGFYLCVLNSTLGEEISNFALLNVYGLFVSL